MHYHLTPGDLTKFHSKYPHISLSIWFISFNSNIFCATMHQLWFEYVSSQTILLAIMNAEMNSRCPEEPRADGYRALRRWRRSRPERVTK